MENLKKAKDLEYKKIAFSVHKKYLLILSGLMWSGVGIFLSNLAYHWLLRFNSHMIYYFSGIILAFIIHNFGFIKIANKNITRIMNMNKLKVNPLAFQPVKSYVIIVIMMSLGVILRHSVIPKNFLAILYFGIGGGLFFSSLSYYRNYIVNFLIV